jgi:polysaccharide biosynthesis/export protein
MKTILIVSLSCVLQILLQSSLIARHVNASLSSQLPAPPVNPPGYVLGPGDQVAVFVADLPDEFLNKTFRVDTSGELSLPVIGHLQASGLTTTELERSARSSLVHVLKNPEIAISLVGFGSQSVSVLGAVGSPGIRQLEGHKTLLEIISASGGLRPDAGFQVTIIRKAEWGPIPLPQAHTDKTGEFSVASVKLKTITTAVAPAENIAVLPGDTISIPKADLVYAVGSVTKPGGFLLNEHESLSALQVLSLAEGAQKTAALNKAKILRSLPGSTSRAEIAVNLKDLMDGKGHDMFLQPDDILFIPNSTAKLASYRTIDAIVSAATGFAVYGAR